MVDLIQEIRRADLFFNDARSRIFLHTHRQAHHASNKVLGKLYQADLLHLSMSSSRSDDTLDIREGEKL